MSIHIRVFKLEKRYIFVFYLKELVILVSYPKLKTEGAFSTSLSSSEAKLKTRMCAMEIGERVKAIRGAMSLDELAQDLGVHKNTLGNYEKGLRVPDAVFLNKLLEVFPEIDPEWLLTGQGAKLRYDEKVASTEASVQKGLSDEFVLVPRYEVAASAGGGATIHSEQIVDYLSFKSEWIRNIMGLSIKELALINVKGDSMEPTLSSDDLILVDLRERHIQENAIYVLRLNGSLLVKRIQQKLDGTVVVKGDNPIYEPEVLKSEAAGLLNVIGRVVWSGRKM